MHLDKVDRFLENVLSYIKFPFVKESIKLELQSHIIDRLEDYIEEGYDREEAEELSIKDMGDPKELGILLNRQHNPILGWILSITNGLVVAAAALSLIIVLLIAGVSLFSRNPIKDIPKEDIVYKIDINERVKIDDLVIRFTNLIYDNHGNMSIFYDYYSTKPSLTGWSLGSIGDIRDDIGNTYFSGSGYEDGGIRARGRRTVENFSKEADILIIDYDYYNRKYKVEIPLKAGDIHE